MGIILLVGGFVAVGWYAIRHFSAEKSTNARRGQPTPFFGFMSRNYPIITTVSIILIFLIILALFGVGQQKRCPRCGRSWSGDGYCYSCRADVKGK